MISSQCYKTQEDHQHLRRICYAEVRFPILSLSPTPPPVLCLGTVTTRTTPWGFLQSSSGLGLHLTAFHLWKGLKRVACWDMTCCWRLKHPLSVLLLDFQNIACFFIFLHRNLYTNCLKWWVSFLRWMTYSSLRAQTDLNHAHLWVNGRMTETHYRRKLKCPVGGTVSMGLKYDHSQHKSGVLGHTKANLPFDSPQHPKSSYRKQTEILILRVWLQSKLSPGLKFCGHSAVTDNIFLPFCVMPALLSTATCAQSHHQGECYGLLQWEGARPWTGTYSLAIRKINIDISGDIWWKTMGVGG